MNIFIWILQGLIAFTFMYSGINKAYFKEEVLVQKGQAGVEGFPSWAIKFIGILEICGSLGLILPTVVGKYLVLLPIASLCLGAVMIPAAFIHYKRREPKNVLINIVIFIICVFIAYKRF